MKRQVQLTKLFSKCHICNVIESHLRPNFNVHREVFHDVDVVVVLPHIRHLHHLLVVIPLPNQCCEQDQVTLKWFSWSMTKCPPRVASILKPGFSSSRESQSSMWTGGSCMKIPKDGFIIEPVFFTVANTITCYGHVIVYTNTHFERMCHL